MRIDQLALLLGIVVAVNLVLLVALELPRLGRRPRRGVRDEADLGAAMDRAGERSLAPDAAAFRTGLQFDRPVLPEAVYQRVVRVVSFLFIGAVLVVATLTGGPQQIPLFLLIALGAFLIVLFQDLLPSSGLGRGRLTLEALASVAFLTALIVLSGGYASPYFFGYVLLVGGAALWASGAGPTLLATLASAAYVGAIFIAGPLPLAPSAVAQVAFNLVALSLITYIGSVVGREQRTARDEALRLSRFDLLTGLYSRAFFVASLDQEIRRAARTGRPFSLLLIDLDGLKPANDRYGHESGDRLLRAVAEVLHGDVRATDVAARYGGDEFVLLLPETEGAGASLVGDKVRLDIGRISLSHNGGVIRTSASIGLVTYPHDGRTAAELMRKADLAMYEAKRRGRDQIVRFARPEVAPAHDEPSARTAAVPINQPAAVPVDQPPGAMPQMPGPAPWDSTRW